jgi:hypothetical protein
LKKTNRALLEEIHATHSATARILVARIEALTEENETLRRWLGKALRRKRKAYGDRIMIRVGG